MSRLPVVSGRRCAKALRRLGFVRLRQKGSHLIMRRASPPAQVVVPMHRRLDRGTLHAILSRAEVDRDDFIDALR